MSKIISSGKLICLIHPETERGANGLLADPPKLAVVWWDYEFGALKTERISWHAAQALAPDDMRVISEQWQIELATAETARAMKLQRVSFADGDTTNVATDGAPAAAA